MARPDRDELVTARLRQRGHRATPARARLVELLGAGDGPMTIPQLLGSDASLAQSSVYRNLAVLEEAGVVTRIVTSDAFARYELAEDLTGHHHHLICSSCGGVADFALSHRDEQELDTVLRAAARRAAFEVEHHRLDLVGHCESCR